MLGKLMPDLWPSPPTADHVAPAKQWGSSVFRLPPQPVAPEGPRDSRWAEHYSADTSHVKPPLVMFGATDSMRGPQLALSPVCSDLKGRFCTYAASGGPSNSQTPPNGDNLRSPSPGCQIRSDRYICGDRPIGNHTSNPGFIPRTQRPS